jgi:UDP-N-acetylglucosamine:LPS N-acetylglucosamine transferase
MLKRRRNRPVILAVASGGGHWIQMLRLAPSFRGADVHYATTDRSAADMVEASAFHSFLDANKDTPVRLIVCALKLAWIVATVRPDAVVSTGAAGGYLAIRIARLLGARTMFIDSIANARELSFSARLSLGVADRVLCQWPRVADISGTEYHGAVI